MFRGTRFHVRGSGFSGFGVLRLGLSGFHVRDTGFHVRGSRFSGFEVFGVSPLRFQGSGIAGFRIRGFRGFAFGIVLGLAVRGFRGSGFRG